MLSWSLSPELTVFKHVNKMCMKDFETENNWAENSRYSLALSNWISVKLFLFYPLKLF